MLIMENFMLAINSLRTNKMRALLTMLGIIIGISSVIAIVSIGDSVSKNTANEMKAYGMNNISVSLTSKSTDENSSSSPAQSDMLTVSQVREYNNQYKDDIEAVALESDAGTGKARITNGKDAQSSVDVDGVSEGYSTINKVKLTKGRSITASDIDKSTDVAVVPSKMVKKLLSEGDNPLGQEVRVIYDDKILTFTIVGVYDNSQKSGTSFGGYSDTQKVYIPVSTAMEVNGESGVQFITVMPKTDSVASKLTSETTSYFDTLYKSNRDFGMQVYNSQKDVNDLMSSIDKIKLAITVIAGIALLVGGIGVMNIMLVSVTERTREIGIRKAIGAKRKHIKTQFIIEAIIICGIGGIIGIALGLTLATVIAIKMSLPVAISPTVIIISVLFSMGIGVFFGFYPANKASKLDPIEALRYE